MLPLFRSERSLLELRPADGAVQFVEKDLVLSKSGANGVSRHGNRKKVTSLGWSLTISFHLETASSAGGKTPWSAITKVNTRYCIRLLCGWLPPTRDRAFPAIPIRGEVAVEKAAAPKESAQLASGVPFIAGPSPKSIM